MQISGQNHLRSFAFCLFVFIWLGAPANAASLVTITPSKDSTTVLRNPMMGGALYSFAYGNGGFDNTNSGSWVRPNVDAHSNIAYLRCTWRDLEPTEGNYAWETSPSFKNVQAAMKQRGYRWGFRIIVQHYSGTPQYVIDAIRAAGQNPWSNMIFGGDTFPDVRNKIWQAKFETFLMAFGKALNDPTLTDYVDANGLGPWGEGNPWANGIPTALLPNGWPILDTTYFNYLNWHLGVYDRAFSKVILAYGPDSISALYGMVNRGDGFGGSDSANWKPFDTIANPNHYMITEPYGGGTIEHFDEDALAIHANVISDYMLPPDGSPLFQKLFRGLGYRLRPVQVEYSSSAITGHPLRIAHTWTNDARGVLPNNNPHWNQRYAVAFALFEQNGSAPVQVALDASTNPGNFLEGGSYPLTSMAYWKVPPGTYKLAVGIIDKIRPSDSSLALAIANPVKRNGWYLLGDLQITDGIPTRSAFSRIEAEDYNSSSVNCTWACSEGDQSLGCIASGNYAFYKNIDFGSGAQSFLARMGSPGGTGKITLHLDSLKAPAVGILTNPIQTSDWEVFATNASDIPLITGIHDLYLEFEAGFDINWFSFSQNLTTSAFSRIEAEDYTSSSVNCTWACSEGGQNLGCIASGNYAFYKNIDFGSGAQSFLARMGSPGGTGKIILHLDSLKAPAAGILANPTQTSDWEVFATNATNIPTITGIHDLYLEFEAGFDLNWFSFGQAPVAVRNIPKPRQNLASLHGNHLALSTEWNGPTQVRLISLSGQILYTTTISGSNANLSIGSIPNGLYLFEARSDLGSYQQRLLKN